MRGCDQEFLGSFLSLETVLKRETENRAGLIQVSDKLLVVVRHHPVQNSLSLYVASEVSMVLVFVEIQVQAIPIGVIWGVQIYEDSGPLTTLRDILNKERARIHIRDVDLFTLPTECTDTFRKVFSVEPHIHSPVPCLSVPPYGSRAKEDT